MPKIKPTFEIKSYGLYTQWDRASKALPKIIRHTLDIPAEIGVEFGFILSVKGGKGESLDFRIDHPPFPDEKGEITPPFEGVYFVNSNDFLFFLGDTVWEPIENKRGEWILSVLYKGKEVARKSFHIS
ncbi:DUF3859 domain-containing protein [Parabacteroides sp. PF5-9]|uniref:DUF3859 domain-containing protein n=1 Tax=Parabacteroides sp. PF5-9 TaxID=1742404 RepID=UPI002474641B|nr:DUF3859 domain-containing protein [Parabacteroides sp. PF5-9]MDH6356449.1 hypothetical protein [Parabacteroides sp. PF5-9]